MSPSEVSEGKKIQRKIIKDMSDKYTNFRH